jgi:hypothetical protein
VQGWALPGARGASPAYNVPQNQFARLGADLIPLIRL